MKMTSVLLKDDGGDTMRGVDVGGGFITPYFTKTPEEIKQVFENIPDFKCRDDDVMLCTYPKTGSNWLYEIMMMIQKKSAVRVKGLKMVSLLEWHSQKEIDELPLPRVLNSHLAPRNLPHDLEAKKIKTVLCLRNPKDVAVSYFNHMTAMSPYQYSGKWENWIRPYAEGNFEYDNYTDYLNEWQDVIEKGAPFPLHVMYYEDMKTKGIEEFDRLTKFLEVELDEQLKNDIMRMCQFDKMCVEKLSLEAASHIVNPGHSFFRKGQVGEWKTWFTVEQNEMFEAAWKRDIRSDSIYKFKYTM